MVLPVVLMPRTLNVSVSLGGMVSRTGVISIRARVPPTLLAGGGISDALAETVTPVVTRIEVPTIPAVTVKSPSIGQ